MRVVEKVSLLEKEMGSEGYLMIAGHGIALINMVLSQIILGIKKDMSFNV